MSAQAYADESDDIALLAGRGPSSEELGSSAGVCCCPSPMRRFCLRVRSELCSVVGLFVLVHIICWLVGARRAAAIIARGSWKTIPRPNSRVLTKLSQGVNSASCRIWLRPSSVRK